jgi:hypothetical protein
MPQSNQGSRLVFTVGLVALIAGCIAPASVVCSDGRTCPPNTRCEQMLCVGDAEKIACAGLAPGTDCVLGGAPGKCIEGLCRLPFCGDGKTAAPESCDGADLAGKTCTDLGFYGQTAGGLTCKRDCTFDTSGCSGACGDRMINGSELCDGSELGGADCRTAGFYDAPGLRCSPYCTFDVVACTGFCGDAKTNGPEQCDGAPPLGKTCFEYGFDRGLVGCSALCGPDLEACSQIGWKTVLGGTFNGVWGAARDDVFAIGPKGKIVRGDGTTWSTMSSGTTEDLLRIWGSGPNDVFVVGTSSILHWNGTAWSPMRLPEGVVGPGVERIHGDLWGSGPKDVYVVGSGGLLHWDGSRWSAAAQFISDNWWSGIWGSGPKDVYVVGGMLKHWDGTRWSETDGPGPDRVWGSGPKDVMACGAISCTHWDGTRWSVTPWGSYFVGQVSSIWGSGPNDVLAISGNHLMHWEGKSWSEISSPEDPRAIWGTGPDDVFVVGGSGIQHRTGDSWFATTAPIPISSLWAGGPADLFVGGEPDKSVCPVEQLAGCTPVLAPHVGTSFLPGWTSVVDVWGSSSSDVFAVTSEGQIYHWDGTSWSVSYQFPVLGGIGPFVLRIWGSGPDAVLALGGPALGNSKYPDDRTHFVRWDGRGWSPMVLPVETRRLGGLWASRQGEAFAVGEAGQIVRWDGEIWSAMESGSTEDLIDVWGSGHDDVFAVGAGGTVLHYDGAKWSPMRSGTLPSDSFLFRVRGSGRGDVFVVGSETEDLGFSRPAGDLFLHLRRGDWERVALPAGASIEELAVTPSRVFLGHGLDLLQLDRESVTCAGPEKSCDDGWDNDCDGLADDDDPDCKGLVAEQCANLFDDDQNGLVDCADPACATFPACRHR